MIDSVETQVARKIAHQERVAKLLERTGGEIMHPDHYDLRMAVRDAVLEAMDTVSDDKGARKVEDRDLPELFRALDALSEKLFLRTKGLSA